MRVALAFVLMAASIGCGDTNAALAKLTEARATSADLLVQFTKAADASNRAVMADTDALSVTFAKEAEAATAAVRKDSAALTTLLNDLKYEDDARLLTEFNTAFDAYVALDRHILDLAVENTNLKAQRLSFGPGQDAADAFRKAVDALASGGAEKDAWRIKALGIEALSAVREIQVLQAVHIADPDDAKMTAIESQMAAWQTVSRNNLGTLAALTGAASRPRLTAATAALDTFMRVNDEIVALSRRNTNVRSLALSLDQKRTLTAPCEHTARALHDALARRGYPAGR